MGYENITGLIEVNLYDYVQSLGGRGLYEKPTNLSEFIANWKGDLLELDIEKFTKEWPKLMLSYIEQLLNEGEILSIYPNI